jgi:hypothetical protein
VCVHLHLQVKDPRKRATAQEILAHPWLVHGSANDSPMAVEVLNRMKCFKQTNQLKQAALQVWAAALLHCCAAVLNSPARCRPPADMAGRSSGTSLSLTTPPCYPGRAVSDGPAATAWPSS